MEPPFVNLAQAVWRHRLVLLLAALAGGGCAATASLLATPIYKAAAVITEVEDRDAAKRLNASKSHLSGLLNLVGIDPLEALTSNARVQQVLRSREIAEEFIRRNDLTRVLYPEARHPVSTWIAARRFRERVVYVYEDRLKGVTTVSMEWPDPKVAARWVNSYVALANEMIRASDLQTAQRKLAYYRAQAGATEDRQVQGYLAEQITRQIGTALFARGRSEYAFAIVDPAMAPELRSRPPRTLMTALGAATGLLAAVAAVFARYALGGAQPVSPG
jgi:uncharacterized protein involved in exopolysaccharide biosynthesis